MTSISDNFSGTLAAWTEAVGNWSINAGVLEAIRSGGSNENGFLRHNTSLASDNHRATALIKYVTGTANQAGLAVRMNAGHTQYYLGQLDRVGTDSYQLLIRKLVGGSLPTIATGTAFTLTDANYASTGVTMTLEADGSSITVSLATPAQSLNVTDTSITANAQVGIFGRLFADVRNTWDNFEARDLAASAKRSSFFL